MIRIYLFTLLSFSILGCGTLKNNLEGTYFKKGKDFEVKVIIKNDGFFSIEEKYHGAKPGCQGKWTMVSESKMLLKCDEENDVGVLISSGYLNRRENIITFINKNKIEYNKQILKKIKE